MHDWTVYAESRKNLSAIEINPVKISDPFLNIQTKSRRLVCELRTERLLWQLRADGSFLPANVRKPLRLYYAQDVMMNMHIA